MLALLVGAGVACCLAGCQGEFRFNPNAIPGVDGPPLPTPSDDPIGTVPSGDDDDGEEFLVYDTDEDGTPDWVWDPAMKRWRLVDPNRYPSRIRPGIGILDEMYRMWIDILRWFGIEYIIASDTREPRPIDVTLTAGEAFAAASYQRDIAGIVTTDGTIEFNPSAASAGSDLDIQFAWSSDQPIAPPTAHAGLRYEFYMLDPEMPGQSHFLSLRLTGPPLTVAGYLADLGLAEMTLANPNGPTTTIAIEPNTRVVTLDGRVIGTLP